MKVEALLVRVRSVRVACVVRLVAYCNDLGGSSDPGFGFVDLDLDVGLLLDFLIGQVLILLLFGFKVIDECSNECGPLVVQRNLGLPYLLVLLYVLLEAVFGSL